MLGFSAAHLTKTMLAGRAGNAIMTVGEVADYIRVTERTIYRLGGDKKIPSLMVGG
jgi:hypothetical protein